MRVEFQPVRLALENDSDGRLVFADGRLAALLSRLSDQHGEEAGHWFLEFGLGTLGYQEVSFTDLEEAERWITTRLAAGPASEAAG